MFVEARWYLLTAIVLVGTLSLGCGGAVEIPVYPTRGIVHYQGEPAEGALVVFHPLNHPKVDKELIPPRPSGLTDVDGNFSLTTHASSDGARAGDYRISIVWFKNAIEDEPGMGSKESRGGSKDALSGKYADPAKSGLTVTIDPGINELPAFELN